MSETGRPRLRGVKTLYEGWGRYLLAEIEIGGEVLTREVEDHGHAACVLPYDPERRVAVLVRQLRAPQLLVDGTPDVLEAPAGLLDDDGPEDCARREAEEEAGLTLGPMEPVVASFPMSGISTERIHLFLAPYRKRDRTGAGGGLASETETLTVHEMPLSELAAMADAGRLPDLKTLALVQTLRLRRPELFSA